MPDISFIIPLFNRLALTQRCAQTLLATLPPEIDAEVLLIDDGSEDGTAEWLATLSAPFRVYRNDTNLGFAGTNNRGAELATAPVLALLNSDLELEPGWLEPMQRLLGSNADVALVGNVQRRFGTPEIDHAGIQINRLAKLVHETDPTPRTASERQTGGRSALAVTAACWLIRRDTFHQLGGFDPAYRNGGEDIDFCLRAREHGYRCLVALSSVIQHHVSASPTRKARDEANSYELYRRWRYVLAAHMHETHRAWCEDLLADPRRTQPAHPSPDLELARQYLAGNGDPPYAAIEAAQRAINREMLHWAQLYGQPQGDW